MKFDEMNIEQSVLTSLHKINFYEPTPIQEEAIPLIKAGNDIFGRAHTGSGKTGAFGIPIVEKSIPGDGVQALILEPTRELAKQVAGEMKKFSVKKRVKITTVYGGTGYGPQIKGLKNADIVVGTPGRVIDMIDKGHLRVDGIIMFVLDEADKMIDMGFFDDIVTIATNMPKQRQTMLFSATMPQKLKHIRKRFSKKAVVVESKLKVDESALKQYCYFIPYMKKFSLLLHLISEEEPAKTIVFCNARKEADDVAWNLRDNGINARSLHGGLPQNKREKIMKQFHGGSIDVLVATDVAARGLDIKKISHIFNYSIPLNADDYANRIGRTARAGEEGIAISLISRDDKEPFRKI